MPGAAEYSSGLLRAVEVGERAAPTAQSLQGTEAARSAARTGLNPHLGLHAIPMQQQGLGLMVLFLWRGLSFEAS